MGLGAELLGGNCGFPWCLLVRSARHTPVPEPVCWPFRRSGVACMLRPSPTACSACSTERSQLHAR